MSQIASPWFDEVPDLRSAIDSALDRGLRLSGAELGIIQLMDWNKGHLIIASQRGFREDFLAFFERVTAKEGSAYARSLRSREMVIIEDVERDDDFAPFRTIAARAGFRSVQSMPLISLSGALVGILSTHFPSPHRTSDHLTAVLRLLAKSTADAIVLLRARALLRVRGKSMRTRVGNVPAEVK